VETIDDLREALEHAKSDRQTTVIVVEVDRYEGVPGYESWWDVAVPEVSEIESVRTAREAYDVARQAERSHL